MTDGKCLDITFCSPQPPFTGLFPNLSYFGIFNLTIGANITLTGLGCLDFQHTMLSTKTVDCQKWRERLWHVETSAIVAVIVFRSAKENIIFLLLLPVRIRSSKVPAEGILKLLCLCRWQEQNQSTPPLPLSPDISSHQIATNIHSHFESTFKERSQRLVTFDTFDQSEEDT